MFFFLFEKNVRCLIMIFCNINKISTVKEIAAGDEKFGAGHSFGLLVFVLSEHW